MPDQPPCRSEGDHLSPEESRRRARGCARNPAVRAAGAGHCDPSSRPPGHGRQREPGRCPARRFARDP